VITTEVAKEAEAEEEEAMVNTEAVAREAKEEASEVAEAAAAEELKVVITTKSTITQTKKKAKSRLSREERDNLRENLEETETRRRRNLTNPESRMTSSLARISHTIRKVARRNRRRFNLASTRRKRKK